jgi:hypothetical protein
MSKKWKEERRWSWHGGGNAPVWSLEALEATGGTDSTTVTITGQWAVLGWPDPSLIRLVPSHP